MNEFEKAVSEIDERTGNANDENTFESSDDLNVFDYAPNSKRYMTCTVSRAKWKNKILQYAEQYPDEVHIKHTNKDGSIVAHIPVSFFRIQRPMQLSEAEKERRTQLLNEVRKASL